MSGLTRERLVDAALDLINEEGLDALSMRGLADRLDVKAASLYWHVRDRRELLDLLAEALLDSVPAVRSRAAWRPTIMAASAALRRRISDQKDADRLLVEAPDALQRSESFALIKNQLEAAGLQPLEAGEVALMVMIHAIAGRPPVESTPIKAGSEASIAIDSGSRGVLLRHGSEMQSLFRIAGDRKGAAPAVAAPAAVLRGPQHVVVRRLRGVGVGEIELNAEHPWRFRVQGPTWNTTLDVRGLDVREIKLDSGAARVECFLPRPSGVVPIIISGGVVGVRLHRPRGVAVVAAISTGAVQLRLDEFVTNAVFQDMHWSSDGADRSADRYDVRISSGAWHVNLDDETTEISSPPPVGALRPRADARGLAVPGGVIGRTVPALEILLDGVEARVRSRSR